MQESETIDSESAAAADARPPLKQTADEDKGRSRTDAARRRFVGAARSQAEKPSPQTSAQTSIEDSAAGVLVPVKESPAVLGRDAVRVANQVPEDILTNKELNDAIKRLPANYNFEIHKTIWQILKNKATNVAIQFPEGLLMFSLTIADIIEIFTGAQTVVMGDVTYGACCIDDFTAKALGCDFMVHYGHSCLVPVDVTSIKTIYVFVEIAIDVEHFVATVKHNFEPGTPLILCATIQFISSLQVAKRELDPDYQITIPQSRPLSPGELLGCTAPRLASTNAGSNATPAIIYLGDGRFHLESIMIANPTIRAFRYDPYDKKMTRERYDHCAMRKLRSDAIDTAARAKRVGLIIGTLGRQGSPKVYDHLRKAVGRDGEKIESFTVLLSEISPAKLAAFDSGDAGIDAWVQTSCPRLSIDWGHSYAKPLLSPYEMTAAFGKAETPWRKKDGEEDLKAEDGREVEVYPMDFYAKNSLGPWTPNHVPLSERKTPKARWAPVSVITSDEGIL